MLKINTSCHLCSDAQTHDEKVDITRQMCFSHMHFSPLINQHSEHERYLCEKLFKKPVVLTDYPKGIKAFYMKLNEDGETVAAADILVPKIGELVGGSQREHRFDVLTQRCEAQGIEPSALWWYLELRKFGTVPHAGFGLGFERLVLFITGLENIRDVIPFPRTPGLADF